jgi:phosphoglycolate phosphatase
MQYKIYLFDFDYTLANSEKAIVTCFQRVLKKNDYPETPDDTIKRTIGMPMEDALSLLTGEHTSSRIAFLQEQFSVEANILMTANTFFFPETIPTLSALKNAGAKVGIISTKKRSRIREKLLADDVDNLIDIIIGREDVDVPKPSPEGLLLALDRLQAKKSEVLYTGDSLIDAHTAKNAQVDFAAVTTGMTTAADFAVLPHKKILKNLAGLL